MSEFRLPSLGADMDDATLREWFVKPGDVVQKGDIVAAVETNKGIIDIEIFESGTIEQLLVGLDEKVPVGTALALYRGEHESAVEEFARECVQRPLKKETTESPALAAETKHAPMEAPARKRISPAARQRARELGVDLDSLHGSGPGGAVTLEDVLASAGPAAPVSSTTTKNDASATGMRQAIAAAMVRSKREIPHFYLATTIDMTRALDWLQAQNAERPLPERMVYAILLLKAVARAVKKTPEMNGFFVDGQAQFSAQVHIGVAISLRTGGLVVPALHDADEKALDRLMPEFFDLVERARSGHLRGSELQDGTITVTSLGEQGVETVFPIIFPPQLAIVGFGSVIERVLPVDGKPAVRRVINASLAADHRVSDGHRGGLFLAEIDRLLQEPESL
ncbi:dihydrolipoamide acetyltransferase family protein [Microbulbifer pacificus]|uniref:Dihydrolipoamide acetyltransferase component of pyruvate dehydrogenase complex n=1 Tax=Microbulbifer pacificus TaxID=407164 RepID=A0AAU0N012_9GAMM|nr:dihydrolipoamide acetyltransferase family protein [Microbulbifer pacificus]WOX05606.1 dihydrolipoamide acetyltransferase family protein [Microbulbifer pacificus]